jgi:hypothetical protein
MKNQPGRKLFPAKHLALELARQIKAALLLFQKLTFSCIAPAYKNLVLKRTSSDS